MSSRAKKKWGFRRSGPDAEVKRQLLATGIVDADVVIKKDPFGREKMSRVLLDFVAPYTASARSHEDFQKIVLLGLVAWNTALLPADIRGESIEELVAAAAPADAAADLQKIMEGLVERKETLFSANRRFILAHHWTMTGRGPHLSVVSSLM